MAQLNIQKEEAKKKEVHVEDNVPAPSPRSNCSVILKPLVNTPFPTVYIMNLIVSLLD